MSSKQQPMESDPLPSEPSPARIETVGVPLSELEQLKGAAAQSAENWEKFLRAAADLDNYRKRAAREKDELARYTTERILTTLLPSLDNLERALEHSAEGTPLHDGLLQVQKQFQRALAEFGLVEIFARPGDLFDPGIHEAVSHIEHADQPDGKVVEQLQSGYKLADRLLRPARVVVSKGPSSEISNPKSQAPS